MALRNEIQAIVATLTGAPIFIYGTDNEINTLADDPLFATKIGVFLFARQPITKSFSYSGAIDESFDIYLMFLKQSAFGEFTSQSETAQIECSKLANQFLIKLREYRVNGNKVFKVNINDKSQSVNIYDKFDINMVGIDLSLKVKTMYNDAFC